jgi:O-antigen/teichoic acid export membrane protein
MEDSKQFLKRLAGFSIGPIGGALISFIIIPLQTWFVDPTQLGKAAMYTMAFQLTSLFIYLGIDQAYVREYNAEEDKKNLLWNSFVIPFLFSIIIMIIFLYFYEPISILLFKSVEKYIIHKLAYMLPFSVIYVFNTLIIRMQEKAKLFSLIQILNKILLLLFSVIILVFFERNFKGIIAAQYYSMIFISIFTTILNFNYWKYKFKLNITLMKKLLKFGLPLIPASIMSWVLNSMDKIALRTWGTYEDIGIYSAAFKITGVIIILQQAFTMFWIPTLYRWYENNVPLNKYEMVSDKLNSLLTLVFALIVLFKDQIILILSPDYKQASLVVPFLMFYPVMYTLTYTTSMGINFQRKTYFNILTATISGIINIFGNILLVPKMGAIGASISTGISYIVLFVFGAYISSRVWEKMNLKNHYISIFLMVIMAYLGVFYNNFILNFLLFILILISNRKNIIWGIKTFKNIFRKS